MKPSRRLPPPPLSFSLFPLSHSLVGLRQAGVGHVLQHDHTVGSCCSLHDHKGHDPRQRLAGAKLVSVMSPVSYHVPSQPIEKRLFGLFPSVDGVGLV
jgi:hypothetical protein